MKTINSFINERFQSNGTHKDAMFLHKDGIRTSDDFTFNVGEKSLLIKYDTDGYNVQLRGIVEIEKVLKNSVKIKTDNESMTEFYHGLKFDKTGIAIVKTNSKYRGKSTTYWVLYNKELLEDPDIKELLKDGNCSWGFSFKHDKEDDIKDLKKYIKEIQ